jgi:hypothetical protein
LVHPADWIQPNLRGDHRMVQLQGAATAAIGISCYLVAAIPADEGGIGSVLEPDHIGRDPPLGISSESQLEDDLRRARRDLDGNIFA